MIFLPAIFDNSSSDHPFSNKAANNSGYFDTSTTSGGVESTPSKSAPIPMLSTPFNKFFT